MKLFRRECGPLTLAAVLAISIAGAATSATFAEDDKIELPAPQPTVAALLPAGVARGAQAVVTVQGTNLSGAIAVRVDDANVTAELAVDAKNASANSRRVTLNVTANKEARLGLHELRIVTPGGASNVARFVVGELPEITETEPNDTAATATPLVNTPVVVNGAINRNEDRDCFRFSAKAGAQIVLDLYGHRLHPYVSRQRPGWLEGLLTVREATDLGSAADNYLAAEAAMKERDRAVRSAARTLAARKAAFDKANRAKQAADKQLAVQAKKAASAAANLKTALAEADEAARELAKSGKTKAEMEAATKAAAAELGPVRAAAAKTAQAKAAAEKIVAASAQSLNAAKNALTKAQAKSKTAAEALAAAKAVSNTKRVERDRIAAKPFRNLAYSHAYGGRQDPLLIFTAPKDGQYVVEVRDELYRGRAEFNYRLTVGQTPFVTSAFPAGGKRGSTTPIHLEGVNLAEKSFALKLPGNTDLGPYAKHAVAGANEIALDVGDDNEFVEAEPNDDAASATPIEQLPAILNGVIERDSDFDCYRFTAKKGQRLIFETVSRSFGSPLDSRLDLYDERGRRLKNSDDVSSRPDSIIDHTFAADGEYAIRIGDATSIGGPRHVYRLKIREPRPDFTLTVSPDNPRVSAGGAVALKVLVTRQDGFKGDIALSVPNPPAGVTVSSAVLTQNQNEQTLSLAASADAKASVYTIEVVGEAKIGEKQVKRQAIPAEQIRYINAWRYVPVNDLLVAVVPRAPYSLSWSTPQIELSPGKTVEASIQVDRANGFKAPVRIVLQGLPSRVAAPPVTIAEGETEAKIEFRGANNAPVNLAHVVANGTVSQSGRTFIQGSPPLRVDVQAAKPKKKAK